MPIERDKKRVRNRISRRNIEKAIVQIRRRSAARIRVGNEAPVIDHGARGNSRNRHDSLFQFLQAQTGGHAALRPSAILLMRHRYSFGIAAIRITRRGESDDAEGGSFINGVSASLARRAASRESW